MCSILGMADFEKDLANFLQTLNNAGKTLCHRGPDQQGIYKSPHVLFQHNRLAVMDVARGIQPMTLTYQGHDYTIIYNGEIYNAPELRRELSTQGVLFKTHCDTEVVLWAYIIFKEQCAEKLNGIFAFAVHDTAKQKVFLCRDRFGVKPLFYTQKEGALYFASEIKALFALPNIDAVLTQEGLWQLIFLSPTRPTYCGIFKDIDEIPPGCYATFEPNGLFITRYFMLKAAPFEEDEQTAIEHVRYLVTDAINRQLVSDVPLCTFLSGGLDSSIITAIGKETLPNLSTYSFEYEGNKKHFSATKFQPQSDDDYALYLANRLQTNHQILTASSHDVADLLIEAMISRDMPGMADIDSSLLFYCREVKKQHTVALSGECSDEIFGGYPWFYRTEMLNSGFFPWIHNPMARAALFKLDVLCPKAGLEFVRQIYQDSVSSCPVVKGESAAMRQSRIATWLSVNWFMTSLLERKDRMSMASGLEVRVPFADHRIVEYVYNVPWEMKFKNKTEKALLRMAMADKLPDKILHRKKSPYPKTHNPQYEKLVLELLHARMKNPQSMLHHLLLPTAIDNILQEKNATWFGQLMSRPQLLAWLIQLDAWFEEYHIKLI